MKHLFLAAVSLLLPLALHARGQCTEDAFEPNDDCGHCQFLVPGAYLGLTLTDSDFFEYRVPPYAKVTVDLLCDPTGLQPHDFVSNHLWPGSTYCLGYNTGAHWSPGHIHTVQFNESPTTQFIEIWLYANQSCIPYDIYVTEEAEYGATPFCGTWSARSVACPCANQGFELYHGCRNSTGSGVVLTGTGSSDLSHDGLRLDARGFPTGALALLVQGTEAPGVSQFGDGLRCISGTIIRFLARVAVDGTAAWGEGVAGDPSIAVSGQVGHPGTRYYQVWYRDPPDFCTPDAFNLSNGAYVIWTP